MDINIERDVSAMLSQYHDDEDFQIIMGNIIDEIARDIGRAIDHAVSEYDVDGDLIVGQLVSCLCDEMSKQWDERNT